jgi:Flp pilus assembly protein TadD
MTKRSLLAILSICRAVPAQTTTMSPTQIQATLLGDLRGDAALDLQALSDAPQNFLVPVEFHESQTPARPAGGAISIRQLRHRVPKEALRAAGRAQKHSRGGKHSEAIVEFEAAVRLDPEFASARNALGIEYARCGRIEEAVAAFRRVIESAPGEWSGHYNLALMMLQSGDLPGALQRGRRARQLAPAQPAVNLFIGYVSQQLGEGRAEKKTPR